MNSFTELIELINDSTKKIPKFAFSSHHDFEKRRMNAFARVNFSANEKYEEFGSNGNTTFGYFKYRGEIYLIVVDFDKPISFYECDKHDYNDYANYEEKRPRFDTTHIPIKF
jgi:hypothetical protein